MTTNKLRLYYPALRARGSELNGYSKLSDTVKDELTPLITLGSWRKMDDPSRGLIKASEAIGDNRAFYLDLTNERSHHSEGTLALTDKRNYFEKWRTYIKQASQDHNIIPVVQLTGNSRDAVRQAVYFEDDFGELGVRIDAFDQNQVEAAKAILSAIEDPQACMFFIDVAQIEARTTAAVSQVAIQVINQLRELHAGCSITTLSSSFPRSVATFGDKRGEIDNEDRRLNHIIGGHDVAIFGDYGSIHATVYDDQPMARAAPRIDYPLEYQWIFERRPKQGIEVFQELAQTISLLPDYDNSLGTWGHSVIEQVAAGDTDGWGSAQKWISVRVNIHISKQLAFSKLMIEGDGGEVSDAEDDEWDWD